MQSSAALKEQEVTQETSSWKYEKVGSPIATSIKVPKNITFMPAKDGKPAYFHAGRLVEQKTKDSKSVWENSCILGLSRSDSPAGKTMNFMVQAVIKTNSETKQEHPLFNMTPTNEKAEFVKKLYNVDFFLELENDLDIDWPRFALGEKMLVVFKPITK